MSSCVQDQIAERTRGAVRTRDRKQLAVLRLINAELKQFEIDSNEPLVDKNVLSILNRMIEQRRSSAEQYSAASRMDLAEQEEYEVSIVESFLPKQLSTQEVQLAVDSAIEEIGASDLKKMGEIMRKLHGELAGRANMSDVSSMVRARLSG